MATSTTVHRDLVVVGASAGGVEALRELAAGLPAELAAAVLVVLHMPAEAESALPAILARSGPLPADFARNGERLQPARIYVAAPDHHLLVRDEHVVLNRGPRQNRSRPSVDALFRSAARWRGRQTIGVILSGSLDDGASGLAAIDATGGVCVVQDPKDAVIAGMPSAALAVVPGALVRPAATLGQLVGGLIHEPLPATSTSSVERELIMETEMTERGSLDEIEQPGWPVPISCPDCSGGMRMVETGQALHYRCHIGHVFAPGALVAAQQDKIEQALWTAVSILEERAAIHEKLAERAASGPASLTGNRQRAMAAEVRKASEVIRKHFPELAPEIP